MKRLSKYIPVLSVFTLALLIRIIYNVTVARNYVPIFDAALYQGLAEHLVDQGCFCLHGQISSVSRPPLWPFIMSIIFWFSGKEEFSARLFYCFLGSGTCIMIYFLAKRFFGSKIALVSGIAAALYPCLFIYDGWLYTESLYTFLLTACVLLLVHIQHAPLEQEKTSGKNWLARIWQLVWRQKWPILGGLLIGATTLTRPNGILLLGVVVLWAMLISLAKLRPWQTTLKDVVLMAGIAVLLIAPWTYRNYRVSHSFVLVSMGAGEVLAGAYNDVVLNGDPAVRGRWRPTPNSLNHDSVTYTPKDDAADTARALAWMRTHLSSLPILFGLHFVNMWEPYTYAHGLPFEIPPHQADFDFMVALITVTTYLVIFLAAVGLLLTWKQLKRELLPIYLLLGCIILQNIAFYSDMRFRAPVEPLLLVLAGGALWGFFSQKQLWSRWRKRPKETSPLPKSELALK